MKLIQRLENKCYRGKRLLDLSVLMLAAVPAILIGSICAIGIKLSGRGPIFFRQARVGLFGKPFVIWKFRTMHPNDDRALEDHSEITAAGRVLRRLSLDELPQLINVAKGEMSIVGPRPSPLQYVARYSESQRARLAVKPGLTGLAQVNGRNHLLWAARFEWDLAYVSSNSLWTDLRILMKTVAVTLKGSGLSGDPASDPICQPEIADVAEPPSASVIAG